MKQLNLTYEEFENLLKFVLCDNPNLENYLESLEKKRSVEINDDYLIFYIKRFADRH